MRDGSEEWPDELIEWVYGPPGELDDEPASVAEQYAVMEEEERIRWIPGYKELVLRYIASGKAWSAQWVPGQPYPEEPEEHKRLAARVEELRRQRGVPPWEKPREETLPW